MDGYLDILNVNAGDIKITFDRENPEELEQAKRTIEDMLSRGYFLLIETADGKMRRVKKFDPKREVYILREAPSEDKAPEVPLRKGKVTAVAPTAGG